jgi:uncharacterized tellurite resistance protein B-like protein
MESIGRDERMRLLKFVCSFAWTDLEISDAERDVIFRLVDRWEFDLEDRKTVARWLKVPPEDVDPTEIPREHRERFLQAVREIVVADGEVREEERTSLALFEELVRASEAG